MECKVCGTELFVELDFRSLFDRNHKVHHRCKKWIEKRPLIDVIPIENNVIQWIYFFVHKEEIKGDFVEMFLIGKGLQYSFKNKGWSIIVWMTLEEYQELDNLTQFLLLKLSDQSIVFLSLYLNM